MSGGGKGGSQTTSVDIPEWIEEPAKNNLARAEEISQIGYTPYIGPDVAAFTGAQEAAFANNNAAANAFGMQGAGMTAPTATEYANGVSGYSSYPLYQQSLDALQQAAPGQYGAIMSQFIDPVTGVLPQSTQQAPPPAPAAPQGNVNGSLFQPGYPAGMGPNSSYNPQGSAEGGAYNGNGYTGVGGGYTGYTGLGDMVDGGGAGASGGAK